MVATTHIFQIVFCYIAQIEIINQKYHQFTLGVGNLFRTADQFQTVIILGTGPQ